MFVRIRIRAFTLIELLVVVAIIALLISILLPSLKEAREQGKRALCLANMRSIGQASHAYSTEDEREHAVPIFQNSVSTLGSSGWSGPWRWRTALPFCYGGATPAKDFPGQSPGLMQDPGEGWTADHRPMNLYIYGKLDAIDDSGMKVYRCPSDKGYYSNWVQDAPEEAKGVPCFDYLGCSYRLVVAGFLRSDGGPTAYYYFSIAPWGHRMSSLVDTGRLAMYSEPMWYNFSRQDPNVNPDLLPVRGWHNVKMTDNVSFADGSARSTKVGANIAWDSETIDKMRVSRAVPNISWILRRGSTWRTDCYPTPGAFIRVRDGNGGWRQNVPPWAGTGWPLNGYEDNIVDPEY